MKRAGKMEARAAKLLSGFAALALLVSGHVQAESARFTIIDARDGVTPEIEAAYAAAMGQDARSVSVTRHIKVLTSARHGFEMNAISLPAHVRQVDLNVSILVRPTGQSSAPIAANHILVARRAPRRVKQTTLIRGQ